jgi:hypothetical protein
MDIAIRSFVNGFPEFMIQGGVTLALLIAGCRSRPADADERAAAIKAGNISPASVSRR